MRKFGVLSIVAGCLMGTALAAVPPGSARVPDPEQKAALTVVKEDASISMASHRIRSWIVDANDSLLIETYRNRWYWVDLWEACENDLNWEWTLGFDYGNIGRLDKFSTLIVDGRRCPVVAVTEIAEPDVKKIRAERKAKREASRQASGASLGS